MTVSAVILRALLALVPLASTPAWAQAGDARVIVGIAGSKASVPYFASSESDKAAGMLTEPQLKDGQGRFLPILERAANGLVKIKVDGQDRWIEPSDLKLRKDSSSAGACLTASSRVEAGSGRGANEGCVEPRTPARPGRP